MNTPTVSEQNSININELPIFILCKRSGKDKEVRRSMKYTAIVWQLLLAHPEAVSIQQRHALWTSIGALMSHISSENKKSLCDILGFVKGTLSSTFIHTLRTKKNVFILIPLQSQIHCDTLAIHSSESGSLANNVSP